MTGALSSVILSAPQLSVEPVAKQSMRFRTNITVLSFSLILLAVASFNSVIGQSQREAKSPETDTKSRIKPTVLIPDGRADSGKGSPSNPRSLNSAAESNILLRSELTWTFGAKEQHGWYLYTALIKRLLNTEENPSSPGFASALSRWQQASTLTSTGILDEDSMMAMVGEWQRARIQNREVASPDQLLTAPPSDFFDPERVEELRQVQRETYAAYKRMVAAAAADPSLHLAHRSNGTLATEEKFLKIISAFRSREYQEQLRRQSPNAGRAGLAVNSPHFTGRALDLYVGGDPVDTRDSNRAIQVQTPVYKWLVRNAERFGFRPYFYEPWHWEYVK